MAKRRTSRRRRTIGKYLKGNIDENFSLGTLASATLVSNTFDESVTEKSLISSIVVTWSVDQLTSPQGPILFGVAHSDYTDAEIEEVIENAGSWNQGGKIEQERAKRLVRVIGTMVSSELAGTVDVDFNSGRPMKTKLNWSLQTGQTLKIWAYNKSDSALVVTVPIIRANGWANLWVR